MLTNSNAPPPAPPPLPPNQVNSHPRQDERERQQRNYRNRQSNDIAYLDQVWNGPDWIPPDVRLGLGSSAEGALRVAVVAAQAKKPCRSGENPPPLHLSGAIAQAVLSSLQAQYPEHDNNTDEQSIDVSDNPSLNSTDYPTNDYDCGDFLPNTYDPEPEDAQSESHDLQSEAFTDVRSHQTSTTTPHTTNNDTMAQTAQTPAANKLEKHLEARLKLRELEIEETCNTAYSTAKKKYSQELIDEVDKEYPESAESRRRRSVTGLVAAKARADLDAILYHIEESSPPSKDLAMQIEAARSKLTKCAGALMEAKARLQALDNMWITKLKLDTIAKQEADAEKVQQKIAELKRQLDLLSHESSSMRVEVAEGIKAWHDEGWAN
ncbi:hypothetical protein ACLX1H_011259 [Fusarium chlamydosporum]